MGLDSFSTWWPGLSEKLEVAHIEMRLLEDWHAEVEAHLFFGHGLRSWSHHHLHHVGQGVGLWHLVLEDVGLWLVGGEESEVIELLMVLGLVVVGLEHLHHLLLGIFDGFDEHAELSSDLLEELSEVGEHELEWVDVLVLVVLDGVLNLGVEGLLLDVGSLDRLIPLVVEATEGSHQLTDVVGKSVDLRHLLEVGVAGVVGVGKLVDVKDFSEDIEDVVEDSLLHILLEDALAWVLDAPVLEVISDSLEVAGISILVEGINEIITGILNLIDSDRPEVFVSLLLETPDSGEGWLNPVAEAFVGNDVVVLGVPSLDEASVNVLQEESVGLHVVELWCVRFWAVLALLE